MAEGDYEVKCLNPIIDNIAIHGQAMKSIIDTA